MASSTQSSLAMVAGTVSRREFLRVGAAVGGGLMLSATFPSLSQATPAATAIERPITLYARVSPGGAVTVLAPNPEMGQGTRTALPMIFAEEFGVAWKDVTIEMSDYMGGKMGSQSSGGSFSTPSNWMPLRKAGAAGRAMFIQAAASRWHVPMTECAAANSVVTHTPSGRTLGYGALADAAARLPVPDLEKVTLKDESTFAIVGTSVRDPDKVKVVNGQPVFGIDIKVPGMLYAVFQKGPVFDAAVKSANLDEVKAMPGVTHVVVLKGLVGEQRQLEGPPEKQGVGIDDGLRSGVAIVADTWWHAQKARQKLEVVWQDEPRPNDSTVSFDAQAQQLFAQEPQAKVRVDGDAPGALKNASKVVQATYSYPFISHSPLEPQNCIASFKDGKLEIWAPTQNPGAGRNNVAKGLGIDPNNITVHMFRCGGGFGRRLANDYMIEAAAISREIGAPVKVLWSREDDFQHDFYRPAGYHKLTAGLDANGKLIAWDNHFVGFARTQYISRFGVPGTDAFPGGFVQNYSLRTSHIPFNLPTGPLRAPGDNAHAFVFQSFIDELAHAAGHDPLEFQLELLKQPLDGEGVGKGGNPFGPGFFAQRMIGVLERVREMSGWRGRAYLPSGTGMGVACYWSHLGYCAQVHQHSVDADGNITMGKVWVAVDIGKHIINPINAEHQVQGAILDGMSAALYQQITVDKGRIVQRNFYEYPLLRNRNIPSIQIEFIKTDYAPTGLGEPAYPSALPALCNAIFAATGKRVRTLPLSLSKLKA